MRKLAGTLTQSDDSGETSLMDHVKNWIKVNYKKTGNVFLGLVHRLDRPVSGVVVFARTSKGASRLSEQFRNKTTKKFYRALVEGVPEKNRTCLTHFLRKEKSLKATVFPRPTFNAKEAVLEYKVTHTAKDVSLLNINLHTGRFHQIRAQFAFIGHPIVGDKKYGATTTLPEGRIALHAQSIIFNHPINKDQIVIECPHPEDWEIQS